VPTALVIQTEEDGPAGLVADRLEHHGLDLHVVEVLGRGESASSVTFPDPTAFDVVVPLGSVHSVYDTSTIGSWIDREVACVRRAHHSGVPVFGICFGAQVLCTAIGGVVEPSPEYEVGWIDVETGDPERVPGGPWFSWHGDRCLLPSDDGVRELARNGVATQAFEVGASFAVQFHPEVTPDIVRTWLANCPPALLERHSIDGAELLAGFDRHGDRAAANLALMLDRFVAEHVR
jgi:GMP synthase-like glutamine amidotransferase